MTLTRVSIPRSMESGVLFCFQSLLLLRNQEAEGRTTDFWIHSTRALACSRDSDSRQAYDPHKSLHSYLCFSSGICQWSCGNLLGIGLFPGYKIWFSLVILFFANIPRGKIIFIKMWKVKKTKCSTIPI